jgi:hypothetical protein
MEKIEKDTKRNLGDEWKDWQGDIHEKTDATLGLFLLMSFFVMAIFSLILMFGQYMINPRLASFHPLLPLAFEAVILFFIILVIMWMLLLSLSMFFNINLLMGLDEKIFNLLSIFPWVVKFAKRFGINRDKMGNSFIKLNNRIVRIKNHVFSSCDLIALLPRCLSKEMHQRISEITKKYNIDYFVVHGGEAAREKVKNKRPKAIVAVACERDLVAGIKDVKNILVLGIPNTRPQGPCRNTCINLVEFENSIRMFLGYKPLPV